MHCRCSTWIPLRGSPERLLSPAILTQQFVTSGRFARRARTGSLAYSPVLLFLEPGVEACLANCSSRPWEPHKYESQQVQDQHLQFLLTWVREYYTRDGELSLAAHQALFDEYRGPKHKLTARVDPASLGGLLP
jgi:hypothetical protein